MVYEAAGIQTPGSLSYTRLEDVDMNEVLAKIGPHCVVKACSEGSSNGVYIDDGEETILDAVQQELSFSQEELVEQYVAAGKFTGYVAFA